MLFRSLDTILKVSGFAAVSIAAAIRRQVQEPAPGEPVSYIQDVYSWKNQYIDENEDEEGEVSNELALVHLLT